MVAVRELVSNLKKLSVIEARANEVRVQIIKHSKKIDESKALIERTKSVIDQSHQALREQKKLVDRLELDSSGLREKELEVKQRGKTIKKQAEYNAIEKELDAIAKQLRETENSLEVAWHDLDHETKKSASIEAKQGASSETLTQNIKDTDDLKAADERTLTEILAEKIDIAKNVPEDWMKRYEQMIKSVPNPIVPVSSESCSSCYYSIVAKDFTRLKRSEIMVCRNCYRLIYLDREEEADALNAQF